MPPTSLNADSGTNWIAHVRGALGVFEYKWWVKSDVGWHLLQPYPASSETYWAPNKAGRYVLQVWVRRRGSASSYDWFQSTTSFDVAPQVPAAVSLRTLMNDGRIDIFAEAQAASPDADISRLGLQWQFWLLEEGMRILQPWSYLGSISWMPPRNGTYTVQVWLRRANSSAAYDAWSGYGPFTITNAAQLHVDDVPHDWPNRGPYPTIAGPGATVTWTTATVGGDGSPLEYQFFRYNSATWQWTVVRPWSPSPSWTWTPTEGDSAPGPLNAATYSVQVWVRRQGSSAPWEAWGNGWGLGVSSAPLEVDAIINGNSGRVWRDSGYSASLPAGAPAVWRGVAVYATGPVEFAFWRLNGLTGAWTLVQPYGVSDTYMWTPSAANAGWHQIQVWVRHVGSGQTVEAFTGNYFTIQP